MNKLLTINGVLLLGLLGFQQWYASYWQRQGIGEMTVIQQFGFNTQSFFVHYVSPLATESYFYFFLAAFAIPVIASLKAKSWHLNKKAVLSLFVINPCLFIVVAFHYPASLENPNTDPLLPHTVSLTADIRPRLSLLPGTVNFVEAVSRDLKRQ